MGADVTGHSGIPVTFTAINNYREANAKIILIGINDR